MKNKSSNSFAIHFKARTDQTKTRYVVQADPRWSSHCSSLDLTASLLTVSIHLRVGAYKTSSLYFVGQCSLTRVFLFETFHPFTYLENLFYI